MTTFFRRRFALFAMCTFLCGCGGHGDVAGKVTFNGKPVVVGTVVVLGSDSLPYVSEIDDSGEFFVGKVPTGPARFAVVSRRPGVRKQLSRKDHDDQDSPPKKLVSADRWFALPKRFEEPTTSELTFDVRSGPNRFDLVLTGETPKK